MADYVVASGESSYGITVDDGRTMEVMSGGTTSDVKIDAGGLETVDDGGSDFTAVVYGEQDVYGGASAAIVSNGGSQVVEAGGTATDTTVSSGGRQDVSGNASGTIVSNGGSQIVEGGGTAANTTIYAGGSETVSSVGTDNSAVLSGGMQDVFGYASSVTIFDGRSE